MGTLADTLFNVLMSWVRGLVNALWKMIGTDKTTVLGFLGKHWLLIAAVLIACGLVMDWLVWLVRWQPYHIWAQRVRRFLHIEEEQAEEEAPLRAHAAVMPQRKAPLPQTAEDEEEPYEAVREDAWLPLPEQSADEAQEVLHRAESVPDEALGAYPGMRYGAQSAPVQDTQRYAAVRHEGPGAAEVERRRAEIDAWKQQMEEERRAAYEAERERQRKAAYEAEQAQLAQEEYERKLAEYEQQKAQYERDLARYEQEKAAYDAAMAQKNAQTAQSGKASELHRRRSAVQQAAYGDYVSGETVEQLPDPPAWPQMRLHEQRVPKQEAHTAQRSGSGLMGRVAQMIEPEEAEIASIAALPPRVDMHKAYNPPKMPQKKSGR